MFYLVVMVVLLGYGYDWDDLMQRSNRSQELKRQAEMRRSIRLAQLRNGYRPCGR